MTGIQGPLPEPRFRARRGPTADYPPLMLESNGRKRPVSDFLKQISSARRAWVGALLGALAVSITVDALTDAWDSVPFLTNLISRVLLLGLTVLLVDEYLSFVADRRWSPVAAFALEDLGRISRAVWVRNASFIQPNLD